MVALPQTFKVNDPAVAGGSGKTVLIPEGNYKAIIINSDFKDTSNKEGKFLELELVIVEGDFKDTVFFQRLNLINNNQKAVEIAYKTLARISEAIGLEETPAESNQLHNQPLLIEVKTEAGKPWTNSQGEKVEGSDKSIIKGYKKLPAVGVVAPTAFAAPAQTQSAPVKKAPWAN